MSEKARAQIVRTGRVEAGALDRREQPLVGVDDEGVGALDTVEGVAKLRADGGRAGVGAVDVQPGAVVLGEIGDRRHRVDRRRRGRAHGCHDSAHVALGELLRERVGAHAELGVGRHLAELELEQPRRLLDGRVRLVGAEHYAATAANLTRGGEGAHRRGGRGVLDVTEPGAGQAEELRDPVHDVLLQLRRGRGGAPQHPVRVQRRDEELREDARLGARVREVGEEAGMVPVRDGRDDQLVEVAEHVGERLALLRRRLGELGAQRPGLDLRQHREVADALEVVGRPVDGGAAVLAEAQRRVDRIRSMSGQGRVFSTCSLVSHALLACATPIST